MIGLRELTGLEGAVGMNVMTKGTNNASEQGFTVLLD